MFLSPSNETVPDNLGETKRVGFDTILMTGTSMLSTNLVLEESTTDQFVSVT